MPSTIRSYLEMIRFSHTIFALPFALTGAILAWNVQREFHVLQLIGILLCMVFARSAAMGFNRLVDRRFDAANPRTANRHLVTGALSVRAVLAFTLLASLGFILSTTIFLRFDNHLPLLLAVPVLLFVLTYSLTKRFTALCHVWLGLSLFLSPVAAWIAIRGMPGYPEFLTPLALGATVLFWVTGFDILYACQDVDFDRSAKLRSVPAWLGVRNGLRAALVSHLLMLVSLVVLYVVTPQLGFIFLVGVVGVAVLLIVEHSLVRPDDLSRVNQAFFHVNAVVSIGLFVIVLVQLAVGS